MAKVILLTGYRGAGKDTVADLLVQRAGYTKLSLAGALKLHVSEKYKVPFSHFENRNKKDAPIYYLKVVPTDSTSLSLVMLARDFLVDGHWTPRALCVLEGSMARAVDPQFWTRRILQEIAEFPHGKYVVSDVRYRSEVEQIKVSHDSVRVVRITRPGVGPGTTDASERDLDNYLPDVSVVNDGTLEQLWSQLEKEGV